MTNEERDNMITATHDAVIVMVKQVKDHNDDLYGNGKTGIKVDVDRLKVFNKVECWVLGAFMLASLTVAGKLVYDAIVT